jgi:Peptidase family M1 domain
VKWQRLGSFCILLFSSVTCFSLDREAFTFTKYDLSVRIEPEQHRLGARGKITLRNDSTTAQKIVVLQIASSLDWRSIKAGQKPLPFVAQPYTSDIDHTGSLSEALVTLPEAIPPKGTVDLEVAYEGVIVLDATRLTRLGAPESSTHSADWDQISARFTAVRGVGNVAWYPVATEAVDLARTSDLFEVLGRWKARESSCTMQVLLTVTIGTAPIDDAGEKPELLINATACPAAHEVQGEFVADCKYQSLGSIAPAFVIADYDRVDRADVAVHFLHGHDAPAGIYADAAEAVVPFITDWFGAPRSKVETADLPDSGAAPFETGPFLLMPLGGLNAKVAALAAAHQFTHAAFSSPRPWINEGLAHFAQALYVERATGRQAALGYLEAHQSAFSATGNDKQTTPPRTEDEVQHSLINSLDEELYRSKAMCVWWMLREMIGDAALKKALASYHPEQDKEPSYLPHLIQAQTQRDLEWFFDDWVYRDRGLPDFKVESVFPRKTLPAGYLLTITVSNLGAAGAEVPLTVKFGGGEITKRVEVRGRSKAVFRVTVSTLPAEIVVNDGSVPESDGANNSFLVEDDAK